MDILLDYFREHPRLLGLVKAVLVLLLTWFASFLLPKLEQRYVRRWVGKTKTDIDDRIAEKLMAAMAHLVWLIGFAIASKALQAVFATGVLRIADHLIYVFLVLLLARLLAAVLHIGLEWYLKTWNTRNSRQVRDEFGPLIFRVLSIVIYTVAVVNILHHFNQDVSSVIVSLGVGSLAVALAAKDTLANMIAGFMIMTDRPFRQGDRIALESGEKGDVYDIGLRTTKILTFDNTLIVVPNHQIINEKVTNLSYPDPQIRVAIDVGVAYGSNVETVKLMLVDLCQKHPDVLDVPAPSAYFVNFGDSSLDMKVVCRVSQWGDQWRVGEELRVAIYRAFEAAGIEIPFPQRDIHIHQDK